MTTKLLVADDSLTIQKVVGLTFADQDVVIESAMNGDEVFQKARDMRPDVVLADVFMPGRNGYEVCADIKADPLLSKTPVVLLVGSFEPFDESEASRVKCDAHITKPFDTAELVQLVRTLVENRTSDQGLPTGGTTQPVQSQPAFSSQILTGRRLVSTRARESFLGSDRILDILDPRALMPPAPRPAVPAESPAETVSEVATVVTSAAAATATTASKAEVAQSSKLELSEQALDLIVDRVVKRMSRDVVREIAWEVIPELSENILRQYLKERGLSDHR